MDVETIKALANLWPIILIMSVSIFFLVYRGPIKDFLKRAKKLKVKAPGAELEISEETETIPKQISEPLMEKIETELPDSSDVTERSDEEPTSSRGWTIKMVLSYTSGNIKEGEEAYEKLQELESESEEKHRNEVHHYYLRFAHAEDASALEKLIEISRKKDPSPHANYYLGFCYMRTGQYDKSAEAFKHAKEKIKSEDDKISCIINESKSIYKLGNTEGAVETITKELLEVNSAKSKFSLYRGLSSIFKSEGDYELRALALEKALEYKSNSSDTWFQAAFAYNQAKLYALAINHYNHSLKFSPNLSMSNNNIGVAYDNLGLKMFSVDHYKKAEEKEESLAMANLAHLYMNAGFKEEASELLEKAKHLPEMHENVGQAIANLSDLEEKELKEDQQYMEYAAKQQRFFNYFAEEYFVPNTDSIGFKGTWSSEETGQVVITHKNNSLEALWNIDVVQYKFIGLCSNRAARINNFKMELSIIPGESGFKEYGKGYCYLSGNNNEINIMNLKDNKPSFITLRKTD